MMIGANSHKSLRSSGNPAHDKIAVKLRLSEKVNWLSRDRSDTEQRLTVKFLMNWCSAFLKDLKSYGTGDTINEQQLLVP